jgi:uncharacterized repeat protein (TIGR03803 family)
LSVHKTADGFKLDTAGTETVLYTFTGGADGHSPLAGLTRDPAGNLYGTTVLGGEYNEGVAFKLSTTGKETVLYNFGGPQGSYPKAGLTWDPAGHLYGTTYNGGTTACIGNGCGVVYRLSLSGRETVLDNFTGASDGVYPISGLIRDSAGNLYGTASMGGTIGYGTVFKVDATGAETVLHNFTDGTDGFEPVGGLLQDPAGNLYGTTYYGGASNDGIVFRLSPDGIETILHTFTGSDGANPTAALVRDSAGNLYGTTYNGGTGNCIYGCGVVFEIAP